jgi:hypothetical protein
MAATTIVTEALQSGKSITREHGEYRAAFDGNTIGYFDTYREAEMALDEHAYDLLSRGALGPAELTCNPDESPEPGPYDPDADEHHCEHFMSKQVSKQTK